jgi:hypothetical protein
MKNRHATPFEDMPGKLDKAFMLVGVIMGCGFISCVVFTVFLLFFIA